MSSTFKQTFNLVNNTAYDLILDEPASKNLKDVWPSTIPANSSAPAFEQVGDFDINPVAVYAFVGNPSVGNPETSNVRMNFFCTIIDGFTHVNMTMEFGGNQFVAGSSIAENNSDRGKSYNTNAQPDEHGALGIKTDSNGNPIGNAIFTVG